MDGLEFLWQMPQGGIDEGESPESAVLRELEEETSIKDTHIMAQYTDWLRYDFPDEMTGKWKGVYRGQCQKWFLLRFLGNDREININRIQPPEFSDWKWSTFKEIINEVVPFKRTVYQALIDDFSPFINGSQ